MSVREAVEWTLLALGVGVGLVCSLGVLLARDVFDRLHFAAAGVVAGPPIAAAVAVRHSFSQPTLDAVLVALILLVIGPLLTIAIARAARLERFGRVEARKEER